MQLSRQGRERVTSQPSCIIVGAGPGLGLTIARRFATGGFDVALVSRNQNKLDAICETLNSEGCCVRGFAADAGDESALQSAFSKIAEWNDNCGVLIYNAAVLVPDSASNMTLKTMMETLAVNLGGAICSVNQVLPAMKEHAKGTILITGGGLALEPYPDWTALAAGKAALRSYALSLHKTLVPENIHVAVIAVCGIVEPGGLFDPDLIAEEYWRLHNEEKPHWRRELVYLPDGADPYYNDPHSIYRSTSLPVG